MYRGKEYDKVPEGSSPNGNTLPSPPIILPILPHEDANFEGQDSGHERGATNAREMAWTSLVDTATKVTSAVASDSPDGHVLVEKRTSGSKECKVPSATIVKEDHPNPALMQLSPATLETDVAYFAPQNGPNAIYHNDEGGKVTLNKVLSVPNTNKYLIYF